MVLFRSRLFHIILFSLSIWGVGFYFFNRAIGATAEVIYEPPLLAPRKAVTLSEPRAQALVTSPLLIRGRARGSWYFEGSFPVVLTDEHGAVLAQAPAQALGEWMTPAFVPFSLTLNFAAPATDTGTLIMKRDNPSGLPEHDAEVSIPIRFQ